MPLPTILCLNSAARAKTDAEAYTSAATISMLIAEYTL